MVLAEKKVVKRKQGRPVNAESGAGRQSVLEAATRLLQTLPPAQVTIIAVAREAGVDPALIRYYFKNREALLFEAVKSMIAIDNGATASSPPADALAQIVARTFRFTRSAKYMQRLMIEELDCASSPDVLEQVRQWNRVPVADYDAIRERDDGRELTTFDPLFVHLAVIGMSDFFVNASPLIELLVAPGTDMAELGVRYQEFVTRLVQEGLRRREDQTP